MLKSEDWCPVTKARVLEWIPSAPTMRSARTVVPSSRVSEAFSQSMLITVAFVCIFTGRPVPSMVMAFCFNAACKSMRLKRNHPLESISQLVSSSGNCRDLDNGPPTACQLCFSSSVKILDIFNSQFVSKNLICHTFFRHLLFSPVISEAIECAAGVSAHLTPVWTTPPMSLGSISRWLSAAVQFGAENTAAPISV